MKSHCKNGHEYTPENTYLPPGGTNYQCRQCARKRKRVWMAKNPERNMDWILQWKYGITLDEYNSIVDLQGGKCPICLRKPEEKLVVDHDHETGAVRGLLCTGCNTALGRLGDNAEGLVRALEYVVGMDISDFVLAQGKDALTSLLGLNDE